MDTVWGVALDVVAELTGTEKERQMLVVVKAPDAMRACRLKEVGGLNLSAQLYISLKNFVDQGLIIVNGEKADFA